MSLLQRGDSGPDVTSLQKALREANWIVSGSGRFDLETEAAVRCFQHLNELTNDGMVGPYTRSIINGNAKLPPMPMNPIRYIHKTQWRSQRDNQYVPSGTCNVTSLATVMCFYGEPDPENRQLEDDLYRDLQSSKARAYFENNYSWASRQGYNPRNVHGMLHWLAKERGFEAVFCKEKTERDLINAVKDGPVVTTGGFTGSGHILTVTGITTCEDFIVQDPYGDWTKGYRAHPNGSMLIYPKQLFLNAIMRHNGCLYHIIRR